MKYIFTIILVLLLSCSGSAADKYAGEIFVMGAGVRNFALGRCGLTDTASPAVAYWNAALLNAVEVTRFELMHAEEYMGLLKYDTFAAAWAGPARFGLVLTRIGINNIPLTRLENPEEDISPTNRPYKYKEVNNSDMVAYVGFARVVGRYNLGLTAKLAYRNLAEESGFGFGADLSIFKELSTNLLLGARLRDFCTTQILWGNGSHEIVNPGLDVEISYKTNLPRINIPAQIFFSGEFHAEGMKEAATLSLGFISLDPHLGLALQAHPRLTIYAGYDIENVTAGLTIYINRFSINYSFEQVTELENSHRVSLGLNI
ncbi:MAG: hypothetical protein JXB60_09630 [Candidatus Cloacimonetes bacterium]|nr:hypothetical protein [Candidatus Cloacimonadota bacterium]